ncbi:hypothetical protein CK203_019787 [Vitis vinifera]|uniref:Uncharacterized protein n=1 Tax=Vitis vinifera TaxID=29760 RepID=A0A438JQL3_VITVI|nr:hypothetical protein CK203_019787 [Vitis vinifera]
MHEVQAVAEAPVQVKLCPNCQSYEHLVEEYPAISAEREMFRDQANVVGQFKPNNNAPYGNTYNSSWRNHPNFSWKARATQYQQSNQPSQQSSSLEQAIANLSKVVGDFVGTKKPSMLNSIKELTEWRRRSFKRRNAENINFSSFFSSIAWEKGIRNASEILEVLRQVKVNIPLLDMIKQVPTYAKFLKDLCTIKRGLTVNKKAFLTEQVSAILQCKSPLKYKDPGSPTISVMIGEKVVEKALLDLGASVNLLPYSVTSNWDLQTTPEEEEGPEEVCIIDTSVEEHCNQNMQDKLKESLVDFEEGLSEPPNVLATLQIWRRIEEILPLFNKEEEAVAEKRLQNSIRSLYPWS